MQNPGWPPVAMIMVATMSPPWTSASAQALGERSPLDLNADRDAASFDDEQPGVKAGNLRLLPNAAISLVYDSNIFVAPSPRSEEALSVAEAQLHVENEPGVTALEGDVFFRSRRFAQTHDQDTDEYGFAAAADAQLDLQNHVSGRLLAQHRFESRTDIETPDTRQVSLYEERQGEVSYSHLFNRFAMRSTVRGRQLEYEEASQKYRDISEYRGELRGTYEFPNGLAVIGSGYYNESDYRFSSPYVASAKTLGASVGASLSIPDVMTFEFTGGYFRRSFAEHLGEISGLSLRGTMRWQPTLLTTIRINLAREDAPTRIVGAYGKIRTEASFEIIHEYSRSINLFVRGRAIVDDFDTVSRTDMTYLSEIGLVWLLSRRYVVAIEYDYSSRDSAASQNDFMRHVAGVSLLGRF